LIYILRRICHVYFTNSICFFVFQLQADRKLTGVSHGRKLRLSALSLPLPEEDNPWFWNPVDASGLRPLLLTGYDIINHGLVCVMAERWHQETSNFHLPVGEMTITLDDVDCLLGIPVVGRLIQEDELDHDHAVDLLVIHLLFPVEEAVGQVSDFGACVTYTALKERYEHLLNRCNHLMGDDLSEDEEELSRIWHFCCSCLATLFLPARTAKPLVCFGWLRFGIYLT